MKLGSNLILTIVAIFLAQSLSSPAISSSDSATLSHLPAPKVKRIDIAKPTHILFVGNSYFYYNDSLHNHVQRMVVAAGLFKPSDLSYKSATIGGAALFDHNIDHLLDPYNLRVTKPFDIVLLQGGSAAALSDIRRKRFTETAADYAQKIRQAGGEPILYMTHAYVDPHRRYRPGMIAEIASLYIEAGNKIDALVIPVGLAFEEAYRRQPKISLHKSFDGSHPDILGTYLAAATVFASIYGQSPVGNSYDYFGEVKREDAVFLQTVAQDVVTKFYRRDR
ncbi:DUF4886 domain-containing protein [Parasphingorhabdus sp.]|uniref:DUF4886 domain-containing protein n=1 Tax=Parasphingorhabdus sp. TaxID=2709688 RepID=UPI0032673912